MNSVAKADAWLSDSDVINWRHPEVLKLAWRLALGQPNAKAIAQVCFAWVRDEIYHSVDYQMNPVTWRASDVLEHRTGYCFAKSHLLAALLRANQIPTGFCYQRLSLDDQGEPFSLHGFNAAFLPNIGWYRLDARGNKPGINAQFSPPEEQLAYQSQIFGEQDFPAILAAPLPMVVEALQKSSTWEVALHHLPDLSPTEAPQYGLMRKPAELLPSSSTD